MGERRAMKSSPGLGGLGEGGVDTHPFTPIPGECWRTSGHRHCRSDSSKEREGWGEGVRDREVGDGKIGERRHIGLLDLNCFHINWNKMRSVMEWKRDTFQTEGLLR